MKVLVCGGRDYNDKARLFAVLDELLMDDLDMSIIQGAARGADSLAGEWAKFRGVPQQVFPAQWDKYGKSAGFRRNEQMLEEGKPDLVVAFNGGRGTQMMIQLALRAGVRVFLPSP